MSKLFYHVLDSILDVVSTHSYGMVEGLWLMWCGWVCREKFGGVVDEEIAMLDAVERMLEVGTS